MKFFLGILFVLISFTVFSQNDAEKLELLKERLSSVESNIESQSKEALLKKIQQLKNTEQERDSLELAIEIYKAKLSITKAKLENCTGENSEFINRNERANSFAKVEFDNADPQNRDLRKGYYVVLASERTLEDIKRKLNSLQNKHANLRFMIAQNLRKSWYHICLEQPYTIETVQNQVNQSQKEGFTDAWFILLD